MLYLHLITIGETPHGPFKQLLQEIEKPLLPFVKLERTVYKSQESAEIKAQNAEFLVVLDEAGKTMSSKAFAQIVQKLEDDGMHITVLLGDAKGLSDDIKSRAHLRLALSEMTFTHDFAHVIFLEQLYRAFTINRGKTYHY